MNFNINNNIKIRVIILSGILFIGSLLLLTDTYISVHSNLVLNNSSGFAPINEYSISAIKSIFISAVILSAVLFIGFTVKANSFDEAFGLGTIIISFALPIISLCCHISHLLIVIPVVVLSILYAVKFSRIHIKNILHNNYIKSAYNTDKILFLIILFSLGWGFLSTLITPVGMDTLAYHLNLGLQYILSGQITPLDSTVYYQYMQNGEIYLMLGLFFDETGIASNILSGFFLPITMLASARAARKIAGDISSKPESVLRAELISALTAASTPLILILIAHTKTDITALALTAAAFASFVEKRPPIIIALLLGGAIGTKVTSAYAVLPVLIMLIYQYKKSPLLIVLLLIAFTLPFSYWVGSNLYHFGTILPQSKTLIMSISKGGLTIWLVRILRIFAATFLFIKQGIDGPFGALTAILFLSLFFHLKRNSKLFTYSVIGISSVLLWLITGGGSHSYAQSGLFRFVLPSLGVIIPVGSAALSELIECCGTNKEYKFVYSGIIFSAVSGIITAIIISLASQPFILLLSGSISHKKYLENWTSSYKVIFEEKYNFSVGDKILAVGDNRVFHLGARTIFDLDQEIPRAYQIMHNCNHDIEKFNSVLQSMNISHIYYTPLWYRYKTKIGLTPIAECEEDIKAFELYLSEYTSQLSTDEELQVYLYALNK